MARTSAHPPRASAWWTPLTHALGGPGPALHLVEDACPEALGELVEALLPEHPELDVHTEGERLRDVPPGSVHVLVLRQEEAERFPSLWPTLEPRGLRVVLFCVTRTPPGLERVEHRVRCPRRAPRFGVAGLRQVLAARAPGAVWLGGDLRATFVEARPRSELYEVSAARPLEELLAEVRSRPRAWLAWTDVDRVERLRRVRWVLADTRHRTRALLVEPGVPCPGWWPVHGRMEDLGASRERLVGHGSSLPGQTAALNDQEAEPLELLCHLLDHGAETPRIEGAFHFLNAPEGPADPSLKEMRSRHAHPLFQGDVEPYLVRMFSARQLRAMCRAEREALTRRLEDGREVASGDFASWTAWTCALPRPEATGPLLSKLTAMPPESVAEWLLASRVPAPALWKSLVAWVHAQGDTDVARHWAQRTR